MAGRYDDRVRDLMVDAAAAADRGDWEPVRTLAAAALALAPEDPDALDLLERANAATPEAGERRQLTVMFCDVVGSTELSQQRDPELVREVLRTYQVTCDRVVRRYEGRIARYIGDGVLAYFGHPVAHEDDARRGVKAGLDLLEALRPVTEEVRARYDIDLRIRVAVHTGVVVRADMGSAATPDRDAIVGDTPNVAARLQDHAAPGTLVISHDTYDLVRGWFLVTPLGPVALKGVTTPVRAYQVVEETEDDARVAHADLSPYVGRLAELAVLEDAWAEIVAGGSRTLAITGQPGVGKSRLADVLRRRVEAGEGSALVTTCSSFHRATALHPARRLLERAAGIDAHQDAELALPRLWSAMDAVGHAEALPYVADLLQLPPTAWCPAPELDGVLLRAKLLDTLTDWLRAAAARGPLLLLVEDVQWADPTTVELIGRLVHAEVPGLLLVVTARDDAKVPWSGAELLELDRLSTDELGELARRLPEGRQLAPADLARAIERSDGIPLFLEELVRSSALAQGDAASRGSTIPSALRDLLLARFAAPGVDLRLAQLLATVGTEAPLPLLAAAGSITDDELDERLAALVDAGIVTLLPGDPSSYRFRHHLLADLAYDTQLQGARQAAHARVADALLAGLGAGQSGGPTVLAHHLEHAGRIADSVLALLQAADEARALSANAEVTALLERSFALLEQVETERRREVEFSARLLRAIHEASIMGYAAPAAVEDFEACSALMEDVDVAGYLDDVVGGVPVDQMVWAGAGLWAMLMLTGQLDAAQEVNRSLAVQLRPGGSLRGYFDTSQAFIAMFRGDYVGALPDLAENVEQRRFFDIDARQAVPGDPGVSGLAHLAFGLGALARFDDAIARSDEAVAWSRELGFPDGPFAFCYAGCIRAGLGMMRDDVADARRWTEEVLEAAERHGLTFWSLLGGYYLALVELHEGVDGALERARSFLGMLRAVGVLVWLPSFMAAISAVHVRRGEHTAALALLTEATDLADSTGSHFWSAEIARQRGEARLGLGDDGGLEDLRGAVALAEQQGATLLELWARTSLCEHTRDPADQASLRELLDALGPGAELVGHQIAAGRAAAAG